MRHGTINPFDGQVFRAAEAACLPEITVESLMQIAQTFPNETYRLRPALVTCLARLCRQRLLDRVGPGRYILAHIGDGKTPAGDGIVYPVGVSQRSAQGKIYAAIHNNGPISNAEIPHTTGAPAGTIRNSLYKLRHAAVITPTTRGGDPAKCWVIATHRGEA